MRPREQRRPRKPGRLRQALISERLRPALTPGRLRRTRMRLGRARDRLRRARLRTRVLAGVLAVTLIALVGFDIAAVTALRGYLLGQADSRLQAVLGLYQPLSNKLLHMARPPGPNGRLPPGTHCRQVGQGTQCVPPRGVKVSGPVVGLPAALGSFFVGTADGRGPRLSDLVRGGPDLIPQVPGDLRVLAVSHRAETVTSSNGHDQLRLRAESFGRDGIVYDTTSLSGVNSTVGQLELILIIGSAAAGLIAAAGTAWIMRRGLRPVEMMAGQADLITAGDLTDRVSPHDARTEVGRLGAALNGMLGRIQGFIAEREASQEATRRFFADASHELRNPLASLRANAELYQQGALPERAQVDEAMRRIGLEAQRMSTLVDDMLRLARLDQHPGQQHDPVDLTALARECVERVRVADPLRTWHADIAADLATVGDEEQLRRAIDNLLANVHAHTPPGTTATLTAAPHGSTLTVEVTDNGPGVPRDQLARIFDRFYRAEATSHRPGAGLGLAIVAATATTHNGTAQATPNPPHRLRPHLPRPGHS